MDGFPVLTGILPHVREPEARDVKGLKDRPSGWRSHLVPHFFAQSTYSALTACQLGFNIDRDSTFAAHLGLVQTFVSPVLNPFLA